MPRLRARARRTPTAQTVLLFGLVVASGVETIHVDIVGLTVRPVHVLALLLASVLMPTWLPSPPPSVRVGLRLTAVVVVMSVVPLLVHHDAVRIRLPGLLVANMWMGILALEACRHPGAKRAAIEAAFAVILVVPLGQAAAVATGVMPPYDDARLLAFSRAPGTFEEATWLGSVAAVVVGYAFDHRRLLLGALAGVGAIVSATRGALVAAAGAIGVRVAVPESIRRVAFAAAIVLAWSFTPVSHLVLNPSADVSSLDSRILDQRATLSTLSPVEWVVGADDMEIYDAPRARVLPATSNNVYVDMVWKQGVFGLAIVGTVFVLLVVTLPRAVGILEQPWNAPTMLLAVWALALFWFANNSMLRPWFWVLAGIALALAASTRPSRLQRDA